MILSEHKNGITSLQMDGTTGITFNNGKTLNQLKLVETYFR